MNSVLGLFYFSSARICKYSETFKKPAKIDICPCTDKRQRTSAIALPDVL